MRRHVIIATLVILATAVGCDRGSIVPMPSELVGTWTTDTPAYEERFFELTPDLLTIGTGGGETQVYTIASVHRADTEDGLLYTINYIDGEGEEASMGFYFEAANEGVVHLQNQTEIAWTKSGR